MQNTQSTRECKRTFLTAASDTGASTDGRLRLARLHTAVSLASEYSTISVHKLLDWMVPRFCWLLLRLHASLNRMYGVPVSTIESITTDHSCCAGMVERPSPSASYFSYSASNSAPCVRARSGTVFGSNSVQSSLASTRRMKRSGVQSA